MLKDCFRKHHMEIPDTQVWWVKVRLSCVEARLLVNERTIFGFHYSVTFGFEALPAASILVLNITFDISLEETALTMSEN